MQLWVRVDVRVRVDYECGYVIPEVELEVDPIGVGPAVAVVVGNSSSMMVMEALDATADARLAEVGASMDRYKFRLPV